jgi:hypothetical protein
MRRAITALAVLLAQATLACSTTSDTADGGEDASIGPGQPVGAPCNASLSNPCAASTTSECGVSSCVGGVCVSYVLEGGACGDAALPPVNALCTTNADCDGGLCGYLATGGCSVTGVCFAVTASSGTLPPAACGCNGLPDPYVTQDFTGTPAASPGPCVDGGPDASDAGGDASDAGTGGDASDAGTGADASDAGTDTGADAAADAADASDAAPE